MSNTDLSNPLIQPASTSSTAPTRVGGSPKPALPRPFGQRRASIDDDDDIPEPLSSRRVACYSMSPEWTLAIGLVLFFAGIALSWVIPHLALLTIGLIVGGIAVAWLSHLFLTATPLSQAVKDNAYAIGITLLCVALTGGTAAGIIGGAIAGIGVANVMKSLG